jgi:polysaccharide biosynthesis transport protein
MNLHQRDIHGRGELQPESHSIDFDRLLPAVRRQAGVAGAICLLALFFGVAWIMTSTPLYTAASLLLIDNKRIKAVEDSYDVNEQNDGTASVLDSQLEVIKSDNVAATVIRKLNLLADPDMQDAIRPRRDLFSLFRQTFFGWLLPGKTDTDTEQARIHRAADVLRSDLDVVRVPRTMILQISYKSSDPAKSSVLANAYAEAYLADQLSAKYEAAKRASDWLEQRIAELKEKALASDAAIQKYKAEHGLITAGGRLVNEQQLNEINTQLVLARAERAKAEAQYERISSIIKKRQTDAVVSEAIGNAIIGQLRSRYLEASKKESEISSKLGKEHFAAISAREEMREYVRLMFDELGRLSESYRSEVQIAKSKEQSLEASLDKSVGQSASENRVLVGLRELEREGETYRNLYQTFLQRYNEALQRKSFPIIEARIITSATPPLLPSHPKKFAIVLFCMFLGGLIGALVGVWREFRERGFQSEEQLKKELGLECLGILPLAPRQAHAAKREDASADGDPRPASPASASDEAPPAVPRTFASSGVMSYAMDNPGSGFSETLLAVKLAADVKLAGEPSKIIGVASCLPGEGKSVFSKNLGSLLAKLGAKTLLIDADLRAQTITRLSAPHSEAGLVEAVIDGQPIEPLLWREDSSGLLVLPAVIHAKPSHTSEFLASAGMKRLLEQEASAFDYIVVDLPPLGPVVDARAIAPQMGAFVLVVEWRRTARKVVRNILSNESELYEKCLGVVVNKVNVSEIQLFETYGSKYFYYKDYAGSYYRDHPHVPAGRRRDLLSKMHASFARRAEPEAAPKPVEPETQA